MKNPTRKRIIVLESDFLLYAGMKSFLTDQEHLDVVGLNTRNPAEIYQAILNIKPDVIIMDQTNQFINVYELMECLKEFPTLRMVMVNLSDNQVKISDQKQVLIQDLDDFLAVL